MMGLKPDDGTAGSGSVGVGGTIANKFSQYFFLVNRYVKVSDAKKNIFKLLDRPSSITFSTVLKLTRSFLVHCKRPIRQSTIFEKMLGFSA